MNEHLSQHEQFLEQLKYYDPVNFITKSPKIKDTNIKSQKRLAQWPNQNHKQDLSNFFSMAHTKQFTQIKQFIQSDTQNLPLLIKGAKRSGKKTTLCQIMEQYKRTPEISKSKTFIANFSCVNNIYSQILYNIMVKIRINFAINQKVQVNEQKIRRYFKYWLDITSQIIERNNRGSHKHEKQSLIIIIDGIDELTNSRGEKVFPEFWLPRKIPNNIKLILSGTSNQNIIERFSETDNVKVIKFQPKFFSQNLKKQLKPEIQLILQNRNLSFFQIKVINSFIELNNKFKVQSTDNIDQILQNYIQKASSKSLSINQIKSLILCLSLSKKGLTQTELHKIMKIKLASVDQFLTKFQPLIQNYNEYYIVLNSEVKRFIGENYDPKNQKKQFYHEAIAKILKRDEMSIRKLEEQMHHLNMAGKNFQIKQLIAAIQNFLILYTPHCKYILCAAWKKTEQTLNSDPVFQYNKSVESFLAHYHPKQQQLFKIIYQLSMFFREYSDFQGAKIPIFRHPLLKGQEEQLNQISVYQELKQLKMTSSIKQSQKKKLQLTTNFKLSDKQRSYLQKPKERSKQIKMLQKVRSSMINEIELAKISESIKQQVGQEKESEENSSQVQKLNLQIKSNRQKFHQHYLSILQPYLKDYYVPIKKLYLNDNFIKQQLTNVTEMQQEDQYEQNFIQMSDVFPKYNLKKIKSNLVLKSLDEYFQENYHRQQSTKFYYYKEWIWIQFPWICQAFNSNFSKMIEEHISRPTEYMSIMQEFNFIKNVLKISQVSKQNQTAIYQRKNIQIHSIDLKRKIKSNKKLDDQIKTISKKDQTNQSWIKKRSNAIRNNLGNKSQQVIKVQPVNLAKYKLDISSIIEVDEKLNEQKKKQIKSKQGLDSRFMAKANSRFNGNISGINTIEGTYLTELDSSKIQSYSHKLPYLNNHQIKESRLYRSKLDSSRNLIKPYQSYDNRVKRQQNQLNALVNSNLKYKRLIQQMQKTSLMMNQIDTVSPYEQNLKKIREFQTMKQKMLKKQQNQSKLRAKLQTIIKICDNNKSHEKESQVLGNQLQNLKIMTQHEKTIMDSELKSFESYLDQYKIEYKEIKEKKQKIQSQIKVFEEIEQEDYYSNQYQNDQGPPYCTQRTQKTYKIDNSQIKLNENSRVQNNKKLNESLAKNILKKYEKSSSLNKSKSRHKKHTFNLSRNQKIYSNQLYMELASLFSVPLDQKSNFLTIDKDRFNYEQSKETSKYLLQQFEQRIDKLSDLQMNLEDLKYENEEIKQNLGVLKNKLNHNENQKLINREATAEIKQKRKTLKQIKNRIKELKYCMLKFVKLN